MVRTHTKYVLLDGCGTAHLASPSVSGAIQKLAEKMSPTASQELTGCVGGCMESIKGKKLSSDDCKKSDSCLGDCRAKASKEPIQVGPIVPIQVGAAMKVKSPIKPRVAAKTASVVYKGSSWR